MKVFALALRIVLLVLFLYSCGCGTKPASPDLPAHLDKVATPVCACAPYTAAKVKIMPLTEFASSNSKGDQAPSQIKAYVNLLDAYDCQVKSPAVFRFELYQYVERSPEPKGRRIVIWPDTDLTAAAQNNSYWRDFLRAYEFNLDFKPQADRDYVLEVTCLCPDGKRLSDDFILKQSE